MSESSQAPAATRRWGINKRISYIGKPLVFVAGLVPLLLIALPVLGVYGTLGANPVETVLDHFGNWALRFILITLAVTPLRHIFNKGWILRFRRMVGLFAYFYVMMHFLTYLWLDQNFAVAAILEDIIERPFITLGFTAVLMLTALAVTSPHRARRALGKRWQKIHYMVYPAAILGVWHFWWQVKKDITEPLIYAVILSMLLLYRVWHKRRQVHKRKGRPVP